MIEDIYNFYLLNERVATGGQPTEAQLADVAGAGYEVVINLALSDADYSLRDERATVEALGMEYIHIPVIWQSPQREDLRRFCDALQAQDGRKVFIHCAANMRVSAFVALFRTLRLGLPWEQAYSDVVRIWTPEGWWRDFIDDRLAEGSI